MGKKKKEIQVPGLPEPWKAYYSEKRERIFYFNTEMKQTTWEMPVENKPSRQSDLSPKQPDAQHQQGISDVLEKRNLTSRRRESWGVGGRRMSDKLDCLHGLNTNETSEELMEIDEIEINCHGEPMEIDIVVEEIQAFRREHFLHPNLFAKVSVSAAPFFHNNAGARETTENTNMVLLVFDTSCLLQDTALLPMCIQKLYWSLIPYTVLQELDGLKKAKSAELRSKAVKTIGYLHDCVKRGCSYLFIENTFEASNGMEEFGCQNNDDIILKCAFATARKYENEPVCVVFVTNDKNLAIKAAAHNIKTADRNELLHLLTTDPLRGKSQQIVIRNNRKISPSDFSFTLVDKPSSSVIKNVEVDALKKIVDCLPAPLGCRSSSPSFTLSPQKREIPSCNSSVSSIEGGSKDESGNFMRFKEGSCGVSDLVKHREVHQQRRMPYSIRKAEKEGSGSGGRLSRKRRLRQLNEHSMADFLEIFAKLIRHLKHRSDRKSMEDIRRINKAIDLVIANESSSLSVLIDMVSKFYDFYADRDVFLSATHFDKKQLANEYESGISTVKEKLCTFQKQLVVNHPHIN
ncbi:unnamed protein product [Cercopithifilaria johnstoni]|uniref:WW domain-containing protein n=1 Tax=Cercopithifilaria johnstoni TaxID=2874296 RepID=A0A8J2M4G0_9BILA|nr:unnamed protein product [Cercopithifilaria johnstoni]